MSTTNPVVTLPRPSVAPPAPWSAPTPRYVPAGAAGPAVVHHLSGQHVATIEIDLGIDLRTEPDGADGIAAVMAATMEYGPTTSSAEEYADHLAACGLDWSTLTHHTGPRITCHVPVTELGPALALITEAIYDPALRPADVAAQTQLLCGQIIQASTDPSAHAWRVLPGVIFDPVTRAGRPADGSIETLQHLTPEVITDFHRTHGIAARAANAVVTIAGDLSGIDIDRHLTDTFCRWPTSTGATPMGTAVPHLPAGQRLRPESTTVFLEHPGAPQTYLMLAAPTIPRDHLDWPALAVAVHILSAPITGRLDATLRQDKGYSYGFRAATTALLPGYEVFVAHGAVAADATAEALADLRAIMQAARNDGFTDAECAAARAGLCANMPMLYENAALVATQTTELTIHRLPHDFVTKTLTTIQDLSTAQITEAFQRHLNPNAFSLIAVGDPTQRPSITQHIAAEQTT